MSSRARAAVGIWSARRARTAGDRGYLVYMVLMVAVVAIAPLARAVWLSATSAGGLELLGSPVAPHATMLVVACLWASALLLGRDRGPALRPPFLTHALAVSALSRSDAFGGALLRAGALVTTSTTIVAGLVAGSLVSGEASTVLGAVLFTGVGTMVGVITTVAWLAGQAFPRAAVRLALAVFGLGALTPVATPLQSLTPWGWVGLAYPGGDSPFAPVALFAVTVVLVTVVPALMSRLSLAELMAQAARWDAASAHATGMDFSAAAGLYQGRPHLGRHLRATRPMARLPVTFLVRDMIGATRTPGRLVVSVLALAGAGALMTFAFAPTMPAWLLGAAAGLVVFAGLGPLTDGIRHAASVVGDLPLYGIDDRQLLANHAIFPLTAVVLVMLAAVVVCSICAGTGPAAPLLSSLALGMLALAARVGNALKGPIPPSLLTPIPTPAGDLGAAVRMAWALDGLLFAALAGASAARAAEAPLLLVGVGAAILGVGIGRWLHRR